MTLKALFVEIYYTDYSQDLTLSKIAEYIKAHEVVEIECFELFDHDADHKSLLLGLIQRVDVNFSVNSIEAEILAAHYFLNVLKKYQVGEIRPFELCKIFNNIEAGFMGATRNFDPEIVYYPSWLGDLYDAFDWCDEIWTHDNSPHLLIEVEKQIHNIKNWLTNPVLNNSDFDGNSI